MVTGTEQQQQVVHEFQARQEEIRSLIDKIQQLEGERSEHELVLRTVADMEEDRTCFRLINNVLCQRTVGQVRPELEANRDKLTEIIETLATTLGAKEKDMAEFKTTNNIAVRSR